MKKNGISLSSGDRALAVITYTLVTLLCLVIILPCLNVLALSLNDGKDSARGGVYFWPRVWTLDNYREVFRDGAIIRAYRITVLRTVIGTLLSLAATAFAAFALQQQELPGRKTILFLITFTMLFSGGMIPTYLLIKELGLLNSLWSMILPGAFSTYNMLLLKNYFEGLPAEIEESAHIDGANYVQIFLRIALPLATPVLATITLFCIVSGWNAYFSAKLYITKQELLTLQAYLAGIIFESADPTGSFQLSANNASGLAKQSVVDATVVCTMLPVVVFYPFLQRFLVSGMVLGSVKG